MQSKVKINAKNTKGNAFYGDDGQWYNVFDAKVKEDYDKIAKLEVVEIEYELKDGRKIVSKIKKVDGNTTSNSTQNTNTTKTEEVSKPATGFKCEVCGKELKDGKFKKCFVCNKNGATKKEEPKPTPTNVEKPVEQKPKDTFVPKAGGYGSPQDTLGKQVGCAINASSMIMSNPSIELPDNTPETFVKVTKMIAEELLAYMQSKQI